MSNHSEETTMNAAELGTQIDARINSIRERYAAMADRVLYTISAVPHGMDPDVDALRELRASGLKQISSELERTGASGEVRAALDRRGAPLRIILIRDGYRYSFSDGVGGMLRRLEELPSYIGADALWKTLPTSKSYWLREEVEGNPYPHQF
jgi:hypothetical protein